MTTTLHRISVIIVNYGTPELTIAAVQSVIERDHGGRSVDVHVVENASPDDSAARLESAHTEHHWGDRVTLYLESENHGFGRGNNVALCALASQDQKPDAVFFLNPDALLDNEAIDYLAAALESDPRAGFAGAAIAHPNGTKMVSAFRFPSVISEFSDTLSFGPVARLSKSWTVPLQPDQPAGKVDWVSGAAIMGRFSTLQQLNFFDPGFFLYYEEVDLMRRGAKAGWHTLHVPQARVLHIEGAATGIAERRSKVAALPAYHYYSWQYYFGKNYPRPVAILAALARLTGAVGNHIIAFLRRRRSSIPMRFFPDFWHQCLRPLLGLKS